MPRTDAATAGRQSQCRILANPELQGALVAEPTSNHSMNNRIPITSQGGHGAVEPTLVDNMNNRIYITPLPRTSTAMAGRQSKNRIATTPKLQDARVAATTVDDTRNNRTPTTLLPRTINAKPGLQSPSKRMKDCLLLQQHFDSFNDAQFVEVFDAFKFTNKFHPSSSAIVRYAGLVQWECTGPVM